jgi:hypothetical protein
VNKYVNGVDVFSNVSFGNLSCLFRFLLSCGAINTHIRTIDTLHSFKPIKSLFLLTTTAIDARSRFAVNLNSWSIETYKIVIGKGNKENIISFQNVNPVSNELIEVMNMKMRGIQFE